MAASSGGRDMRTRRDVGGRDEGRRDAVGTSYREFDSARKRFLETLRVDAEIRRLERLWRTAAPDPASREPGAAG